MNDEVLSRLIIGVPLILLALWQVWATRKYVRKLKGPAGASVSEFLPLALTGSYLAAVILISLALVTLVGMVG